MAGVVSVPERTLKKINSYILPQWKVCFFAAFIVGLIAHLYKITNWLPNWDSIVFRYDSQNMIGLGRWFLPVVCSFSSFYDLPFLNGIIAIIFHAIGAVCICKMFKVEKSVTAFIIGGTIVSFPTVTSVMMYNYVADGYSIAFFFSVLAAVFMTSDRPKYYLSSILIALAVGIYQAYITVTITLVLLWIIDRIIYSDDNPKEISKKVLYIFISGFAGVIVYALILKILLLVLPVELSDYQGINSSLSLSNIDIRASLYSVKETFVNCFFDFSEGANVHNVLNIIVAAIAFGYSLFYVIANKIYRSPLKVLILVLVGVMLVIGAGVLAFVNAGVDYHNLMLMGYATFYLVFLLLYEKRKNKSGNFNAVRCWTVLSLSLMIIFNQIVISNVSYHKAQIAYEKSYGTLIRISDRIDRTPKADGCDEILVIGSLDNSSDYSVTLSPNITGITDGYIIRADDESVGQSVLCSALNDYCDKKYKFISGDRKKDFLKKSEVAEMKVWPEDDCVRVVDNVIVIKLGAEGE